MKKPKYNLSEPDVQVHKIVGANIKRIRRKIGTKANYIASELNLSVRTIYNYESGGICVPLHHLVSIANILEVRDISLFFDGCLDESNWTFLGVQA